MSSDCLVKALPSNNLPSDALPSNNDSPMEEESQRAKLRLVVSGVMGKQTLLNKTL